MSLKTQYFLYSDPSLVRVTLPAPPPPCDWSHSSKRVTWFSKPKSLNSYFWQGMQELKLACLVNCKSWQDMLVHPKMDTLLVHILLLPVCLVSVTSLADMAYQHLQLRWLPLGSLTPLWRFATVRTEARGKNCENTSATKVTCITFNV